MGVPRGGEGGSDWVHTIEITFNENFFCGKNNFSFNFFPMLKFTTNHLQLLKNLFWACPDFSINNTNFGKNLLVDGLKNAKLSYFRRIREYFA